VIDVTDFIPKHPGGEGRIMRYAGRDATEAFYKQAHSTFAREIMYNLAIGLF